MDEPIRVAIIDDNADARSFLRRLLSVEDNVEIVGEAEDGQGALDLTRAASPHVVLMDMNMPVMDGVTACGHIKREMPAVQVIILSVQDDPGPMRAAIEQGASAFLIKPAPPDDLVDLIRRAYAAYRMIAAGLLPPPDRS
jgi:DNA-binding NarL/FixJ family response regulator